MFVVARLGFQVSFSGPHTTGPQINVNDCFDDKTLRF